MSLCEEASTARCRWLSRTGMAIAAKIPMTMTTTSSSMRVKPPSAARRVLRRCSTVFRIGGSARRLEQSGVRHRTVIFHAIPGTLVVMRRIMGALSVLVAASTLAGCGSAGPSGSGNLSNGAQPMAVIQAAARATDAQRSMHLVSVIDTTLPNTTVGGGGQVRMTMTGDMQIKPFTGTMTYSHVTGPNGTSELNGMQALFTPQA